MNQPTDLIRRMLKSKIHRARVTQADLEYEGSITIDQSLLEAADILAYEQVHVWNVTRGARLTTYAIVGERDSGVICINGAAAHLIGPGDIVIIAAFTDLPDRQARGFEPRIVLLDAENKIKSIGAGEIAGPGRRIDSL